jgi:hypothetical protein
MGAPSRSAPKAAEKRDTLCRPPPRRTDEDVRRARHGQRVVDFSNGIAKAMIRREKQAVTMPVGFP